MFNMRTACNAAHVNSVLWLLLNVLQHVLGNSRQCGGVSLLTICHARKLNWRLLPKMCCSMFRRSHSTNCTCAALQVVRILNIYETFHEIHLPLNFLFKFTGINLVQFNINPVEFHLIRLCSFYNIYMLSDLKFFKHPVFVKKFLS